MILWRWYVLHAISTKDFSYVLYFTQFRQWRIDSSTRKRQTNLMWCICACACAFHSIEIDTNNARSPHRGSLLTHSLIHSLTVRIHSFDQSFVRICKNLRARVNNSIAWVIYKKHLRGRERRENDDGARALFLKFSTEKRHNRWIAFWSAIMQFSLFGKHHKKFTNEKSTKETKRKMYVQSIDVRVLKKRLMNSY